MKALSLKIPDDLDKKLRVVARSRQTSKSEVVRRAVEEHVSTKGIPQGSALDLAGDLVGFLEGPGDLSHNKRRMRNYGR